MKKMENKNWGKISDILIEAMKAKNLSAEKISHITGIQINAVENLINDKFEDLPATPYVRGYIIKISEVLGLDGEKIWKEFIKEKKELIQTSKSNTLIKSKPNLKTKKYLILSTFTILIIVVLLIRFPYFAGKPEIIISTLKNDLTTTSTENIEIKGRVINGEKININGEFVDLTKDGEFSYNIKLTPGFNTLNFEASKIKGQKTNVIKQIYYLKAGNETNQTYSTSTNQQ